MPAFPIKALLTLFFLSGTLLHAQKLYMPRNIQQAYDKQTRSNDGKPGPKYWQNRASYRIDVAVDLPTRKVSGHSNIKYFNNSPDTLDKIRLKLAHDLWRKNGQRAYDLSPESITDGVDISKVRAGDTLVQGSALSQANTFLDIDLNGKPVAPGASLEISLDWSYIAPPAKGAPREGVYDSTTWFAAYWYPQVAVYDDLHGWADAPYNGLQEMYNDFSDYEVNITVPGTIMVWATGVWDNAAELLETEFLSRYEAGFNTTDVIKVFSPEDYAAKKSFFKPAKTQTFRYKAENVPDFAFAFSDHYLWDITSARVDMQTKRRALVSAAYHPASKDYYEVCQAGAQALQIMSTWMPGYPYPYPRMTVFNGSGGMEFPMMCNNGSTHPRSPVGLTVHETSHTYFPFMMGINEQYYAWMDEGWASFFDVVVTDSIMGKSHGRLRDYARLAGTDMDMPPMTPSRHLSGQAYRVASYNRAQAAYFTLYQMMGYERFHRCMAQYMERWKGKHPQPFDFFNTWNAISGENLDWFWKPWFFDWGYPDLAVADVTDRGVIIENRGTMPLSVIGEIEFSDGSKEVFKRTASVWNSGSSKVTIPVAAGKTVQKVTLGDPFVSDTVEENNTWMKK